MSIGPEMVGEPRTDQAAPAERRQQQVTGGDPQRACHRLSQGRRRAGVRLTALQ